MLTVLFVSLALASPVVQVSGVTPRFFVKADGTVLANGSNNGFIVPGITAPSVNFTPIQFPGPVRQVEASASMGFALMRDGTVMAWGNPGYSLFGNGRRRTEHPLKLEGLVGITQIGLGFQHAAALRNDGKVLAWGQHTYGVLGDGKDSDREEGTPNEVDGVSDVTDISVGGRTTLALRKDGTVWAWGINSVGQLGQGTSGNYSAHAVQVKGLTNVRQIAADKDDNGANAALTSDGRVWVWGGNGSAMLGNGVRTGLVTKPTLVKGIQNAKRVTVGHGVMVVVHTNGTVSGWGFNGFGGLGIRSKGTYLQTPTRLTPTGVSSAFTVGYGTFLVKANGALLWSGGPDGSTSGPMNKRTFEFKPINVP